jgi:hypothetical protein
VRHTPLSDLELAELRALCAQLEMRAADASVERLRHYASHLVLDVLALRRELHVHVERSRFEHERLLDMLDRARPHLAGSPLEEDLRSLLVEIGDALTRSR